MKPAARKARADADADARPLRGRDGAPEPSGEPADAQPAPNVRSALQTLGLVVAPATALTALLVYFGWARANAEMRYFGVDLSVLELSTRDYVLRSVGSVFWALVVIVAGVALALLVHRLAGPRVADSAWARPLWALGALFALVGAGFVAVGTLALLWRAVTPGTLLVTPAFFVLGIPLAAYGVWLLAALGGHGHVRTAATAQRALVTVVGILTGVFLFWAVGDYADLRGTDIAELRASRLDNRPSLVLYSKERLALGAPGVRERDLGERGGLYRYRYSRLKLLIRSGGKLFLLPSDWSTRNRVLMVVPESGDVRFELHCVRTADVTGCAEAEPATS